MDTPASLSSKRIGCIGCGNMGGAILGGLAEVPGLELYGYNRTPQRLEPLCAKGITAVPDIPGIAARCDGNDYVTQSAHVNFLRNTKQGTVYALAEIVRRGRHMVVLHVTARDAQERLLADCAVDMMRMEQ